MAFLGNCAVQWLNIKRPMAPYLFLLAALALGWFVARSGGFTSTPMGRLETAIVLTCPLFFSGIVFSTLLTHEGQVSGVMASNLLGAICGGLLEYNSMYFGFRSLYVLAMACYLLAFASRIANQDLTRVRQTLREAVAEWDHEPLDTSGLDVCGSSSEFVRSTARGSCHRCFLAIEPNM